MSEEGQQLSKARAGVAGPLAQAGRRYGRRDAREWGAAKTPGQHVATAAALPRARLVAWLDERPRAQTRPSRCAALAPVSRLA